MSRFVRIMIALLGCAPLSAGLDVAHAINTSRTPTTTITPAPVCAHSPIDRRVPGRLLVGDALYGLATDDTTGHTFALSNGSRQDGGGRSCSMAVFTLDGWSGKVLARTRLGTGAAATFDSLAVSGPAHRVFVLDAGGSVQPTSGAISVLDSRTGGLVQTITQLPSPQLIVADAATYRAFVLYNSSPTNSAVMSIGVIAVSRGVVVRRVPIAQRVAALAIDERARRVFLLGSSTVTTLDAASGSVTNVAALPTGQYIFHGYGLDRRTGRLFVALQGEAPSHGTTPNPPNLLVMLDTRTGKVVRTISQSGDVSTGSVVVDEPAGVVLSLGTETAGARHATVLDAATGAVLSQVMLALPLGGFVGPTTVDARSGDIFGYTYDGIRGIRPDHWNTSRIVSRIAYPIGEVLAINRRTHRVFALEIDPPAGPYRSFVKAFCEALNCR